MEGARKGLQAASVEVVRSRKSRRRAREGCGLRGMGGALVVRW